jgi:hypothetical protein
MDFAFGEERQIAGSVITSRKVYDETDGWAAEDGSFRLPVFVVTRWHRTARTGQRSPRVRHPRRLG